MDNNWIPVKEKLPEVGEYVLLIVYSDTVLKGQFHSNGWSAFFADGQQRVEQEFGPSHWQPLPSAPGTTSTPSLQEQLSAAVAREAKLRQVLTRWQDSNPFTTSLSVLKILVEDTDAALSDTTPSVLPVETPDKDAVYYKGNAYESIGPVKIKITDVLKDAAIGEWIEGVVYKNSEGKYARERQDFGSKFMDKDAALALLRETAVRTQIVFPENEQEIKWFEEGLKQSGGFMGRLFNVFENNKK